MEAVGFLSVWGSGGSGSRPRLLGCRAEGLKAFGFEDLRVRVCLG